MKTIVLLISLSLAGCATCREHPVGCAVVGAAGAAIAVAAINAYRRDNRDPVHIARPAICNTHPSACY